MNKKTRLLNLLIIFTVLLGACNLPSDSQGQGLELTAAAQTVEALLSATPLATNTSLPPAATLTTAPLPLNTNTPVPTATLVCNLANFVTDVTIPDGTIMTPGQAFNKKWRIKNIGTCAWNGYTLIFDHGDAMGGPASKPIPAINPGQEFDLDVDLTAPASAGAYRGYWRIASNSNVLVPIVDGYQGTSFYVDIKVQSPATATTTATATTAPFAVTSVNYILGTWSDATYTNCPRVTANITANGAGMVSYTWKTTSGTNPTKTLNFAAAGTQSINYDWALGSVWNGTLNFVGIYIDSPNHQDFGKLEFTTACTSP